MGRGEVKGHVSNVKEIVLVSRGFPYGVLDDQSAFKILYVRK